MMLSFWGRGLLIGGLIGLAVSFGPAFLFGNGAPGFLATLSVLLSLTVGPLSALAASVGAILLLLAWLRR